ncbi:BRO-N domain-containing protein [Oceanibaculum indicum]|nr:BRO family protein [Oceanibaculum indicum]
MRRDKIEAQASQRRTTLAHTIRVVTIDGQPWFVAADVAAVLDFSTTAGAGWYARHLKDSERNTIIIRDGNRGNPLKTIINEAGLYRLIMRSDEPEARVFQNGVTRLRREQKKNFSH